jgi:hypothetical protein
VNRNVAEYSWTFVDIVSCLLPSVVTTLAQDLRHWQRSCLIYFVQRCHFCFNDINRFVPTCLMLLCQALVLGLHPAWVRRNVALCNEALWWNRWEDLKSWCEVIFNPFLSVAFTFLYVLPRYFIKRIQAYLGYYMYTSLRECRDELLLDPPPPPPARPPPYFFQQLNYSKPNRSYSMDAIYLYLRSQIRSASCQTSTCLT